MPIDIVFCKECVHRPKTDRRKMLWIQAPYLEDGSIDRTCPFLCEDPFYNELPPEDHFFCAFGKRKEKENVDNE